MTRDGVSCPVVHLELRTHNRARACCFLHEVLGWGVEQVRTAAGTYLTLGLGTALEGGVVESDRGAPIWIPYVEVPALRESTERALSAGASLVLAPREGPVGWWAIVAAPACGELALWQPKR